MPTGGRNTDKGVQRSEARLPHKQRKPLSMVVIVFMIMVMIMAMFMMMMLR